METVQEVRSVCVFVIVCMYVLSKINLWIIQLNIEL